MNYFHIEAERMGYTKAKEWLQFAEQLTEVISCRIDDYQDHYVHMLITGNQETCDQVIAFAYSLNDGAYCEATTITEDQLDQYFAD
jgi:outer membrane protein assembly factor BamA